MGSRSRSDGASSATTGTDGGLGATFRREPPSVGSVRPGTRPPPVDAAGRSRPVVGVVTGGGEVSVFATGSALAAVSGDGAAARVDEGAAARVVAGPPREPGDGAGRGRRRRNAPTATATR